MPTLSSILPAAALWLLATVPVHARAADADSADRQPAAATVGEAITVTANRLALERETVGASVTVITARDIARRQATSVADLLRTVPGVAVARTAGAGGQTSVFLRGGASTFTLVLVDGVRINSATTGGVDFADLGTDNIERIEIVRGPQSTLYGSEAIGGVISITTRRGSGAAISGDLLAEAGGGAWRRLRATVRGGRGAFDYSLSASDTATDGVSAASERAGNTERDGYDRQSLAGRLGFTFRGDGRLELALRAIESDLEVDGFGFADGAFRPLDDPNASQRREALIGEVRATLPLTARWRQSVRVGRSDEELTNRDPDTPFNNFASQATLTTFGTQADLAFSEHATLVVGAEHEDRQGVVDGAYDQGADIVSFYAQHRWSWRQRLHLTLGARHDDHQTFGGETTYRLTGSWDVAAATRLHGTFGTGFRAPSLNELYFPFFGNPQLAPETSEGFDLGLERRFAGGRVVADLTYFDNDFENLIGTDAAFRAVNIAAAAARGLELGVDLETGAAGRLRLAHTWTDSEDRTTGLPLARRPEHQTALSYFLEPLAGLDLTATAVHVRDRIDTDGSAMDDYTRVDLTVRYRLPASFTVFLRAENLLDEDYEEVNGFTTPGAWASLSLRYDF